MSGGGYGFADWLEGVPYSGWDGFSGTPTMFSEYIGTSVTVYVVATFSGAGYLGSSGMSNILCLVVPPVGGTPTIAAGSCPGQ